MREQGFVYAKGTEQRLIRASSVQYAMPHVSQLHPPPEHAEERWLLYVTDHRGRFMVGIDMDNHVHWDPDRFRAGDKASGDGG